jgi:hypothetical protein
VDGGWLLCAAWLAPGCPQQVLTSCGQLRAGPVFCSVTDLAIHPGCFADFASGAPGDGVHLDFRSPNCFARDGARVVTPDPRLIAGSWRRHWNTHATEGLRIGDEDWCALTRSLNLTEFYLGTQPAIPATAHPPGLHRDGRAPPGQALAETLLRRLLEVHSACRASALR